MTNYFSICFLQIVILESYTYSSNLFDQKYNKFLN